MTEYIAGMGEMVFGASGDTLTCLGLGSCVSVAVFDKRRQIAGMAHIMLPDSINAQVPLKKTVILADSDATIRSAIKMILAEQNYEVLAEAMIHDELFRLYAQHRPEVLFLSEHLPQVHWSDSTNSILTIDKGANIILLSANPERSTFKDYYIRGIQDVILNPYTKPKVLNSMGLNYHKKFLKFADKAIPVLKSKLLMMGASEEDLVAKIVGGAHMFPSITDDHVMQIGKRNISSVKELLMKEGIVLVSEDVGNNIGRTARFDVSSTQMSVMTKDGQKMI